MVLLQRIAMYLLIGLLFAPLASHAQMQKLMLSNKQKKKFLEEEFPKIVRRLESAVVRVRIRLLGGITLVEGNGFFVSYNGVVATSREILNSVLEDGVSVEVVTSDGTVLRNPKIRGCTGKTNEICFLATDYPPNFWFRDDFKSVYVSGEKVYSIGTPVGESGAELSAFNLGEITRVKFPKTENLILEPATKPGLSGAPLFDMFGGLVGMVGAKNLTAKLGETHAVGANTFWKYFEHAEKIPAHSAAFLQQARGTKLAVDSYKIKKILKRQLQLLAHSGALDESLFKKMDFEGNGLHLEIPFPHEISEKNCARSEFEGGARMDCGGAHFQFFVEIRTRQDSIRFLDALPVSTPRPLDMVEWMNAHTPDYWRVISASLAPNLRARLQSNPGAWTCRETSIPDTRLFRHNFSCSGMESDYRQLGRSMAHLIVQPKDLDSTIEFGVSADKRMYKAIWAYATLLARGSKVENKTQSRGIASVSTASVRMKRVHDFCYIDAKYCRITRQNR